MKFLLASESYWPMIDGGAVAEHNLCLELAKRSHKVHIIAPSNSFKDEIEIDHNTIIHRVASVTTPLLKNNHRFSWFPGRKIHRIIKEVEPDVVHIHNPFFIGKATLRAAKKEGIPTVATNHWLPENMTTFMSKFRIMNSMNLLVKLNWRFINKFHNICDYTTAPTDTAIDLMVKNGLTAPHKPVSNGVNSRDFNPSIDPSPLKKRLRIPDIPTAIYAGRLSGEKYVDVFIKAMPAVLKEHDVHFIVGGNGREKEPLEELVKSLGIERHVTFTGFLDDDEFPMLYNAADIFVMPSTCELQSITTLEALASGLPVIAANKYALPELVHHDRNGYLFEPHNVEQLSAYLSKLFAEKSIRKDMGSESLKIVQAHTIENTVSDYESIYNDLIAASN